MARDKSSRPKTVAISGAVKQPLPTRIEVQLATLTKEAPEGDDWLHEVKYDGYRMICRIDGKNVSFISRNYLDWTDRLELLATAAKQLPAKQAIIDGEVVVIRPDGITDFQALQNVFRENRQQELQYFAFDLLYLDGYSLIECPLEERKAALANLLSSSKAKLPIHYSDHVVGSGKEAHQLAYRKGLEGIISKRRQRPYVPGRGYDWVKVKCVLAEEFVIGGFTEPSGSRAGLGALLVGYYDDQNKLHYAGKVGTGFDARTLIELREQLQRLEQSASPFVDRTTKSGDIRTAHWLKPSKVAQITYGSRTREGILRHAVFAGLREDKPAGQVRLDEPMPVSTAVKKSGAKRTAPRK